MLRGSLTRRVARNMGCVDLKAMDCMHFKVGITESPNWRFYDAPYRYSDLGYEHMFVLVASTVIVCARFATTFFLMLRFGNTIAHAWQNCG